MILNHLQHRIESQYDLAIPYDVTTFVSHDPDVARTLSLASDYGQQANPDIDIEVVFVRQDADTLEFTLYLDQELVEAFDSDLSAQDNHRQGTTAAQYPTLDDICTLVEGVSHAVCLLWHAHHDRQVRPVDLELQAEIDKFTLLLDASSHPAQHMRWHHQLFARWQLASNGSSVFQERYRVANELASRYCHWLVDEFIDPSNRAGLDTELARFYRLSGNAKFEHIKRLH